MPTNLLPMTSPVVGQVIEPTPPPSGLEIPVGAFRGRYFDNQDLTNMKLERIDPAINFVWGSGSPDPLIAKDTFSVRWEGLWDFAVAGTYRFTMTTDDGMRLWIDDVLILDAWVPQAPTTYTRDVPLTAGRHLIKVEYFEQTGNAVAQVAFGVLATDVATSLTLVSSPNPSAVGASVAATGVLTRLDNNQGVPGQSIHIESSTDGVTWNLLTTVPTGTNGDFSATLVFGTMGSLSLRARFDGASVA